MMNWYAGIVQCWKTNLVKSPSSVPDSEGMMKQSSVWSSDRFRNCNVNHIKKTTTLILCLRRLIHLVATDKHFFSFVQYPPQRDIAQVATFWAINPFKPLIASKQLKCYHQCPWDTLALIINSYPSPPYHWNIEREHHLNMLSLHWSDR